MKFPKMFTLWRKDEDSNWTIVEGDFAKQEFKSVQDWIVTEKVDGTNIRVYWHFKDELVEFRGRTDDAVIPVPLLAYLEKIFSVDLFKGISPEADIVLFGEGYGPKIQAKGHLYRDDPSFILFDAVIGGWWLNYDKVVALAEDLGIDVVPCFGIMNIEQITSFVRSKKRSLVAFKDVEMEGVVAKSYPLMLFRNGDPVMFKLRVADYAKLERTKRCGVD